jgi:hypothetical protein
MEDLALELSGTSISIGNPDDAPTPPPPRKPGGEPAENPVEEEQTGIIPGKIPGQPNDPADPRFPGSQPDLA